MTQIVTPPELLKTTTADQIDKAVANYRALLEKHSGEFNADAVQTVLGQSEFANEQFAVFRRRVEVLSNLIVRKVVDNDPKGDSDVEIMFFKPEPWEYTRSGFMSEDDYKKCFDRRNLRPADLTSVVAVNEADQVFVEERPHGIYCKDANDNWCYVTIYRRNGKCKVHVRHSATLYDGWWFAGIPRLPYLRTRGKIGE